MTAYVRCEWWGDATRCKEEVTHVVIYGCLDMHIRERGYCPEHLYAWESMVYDSKGYCAFPPCPRLIELWEKVPTGQLTLGFVMELAKR